MARIRPFCAVRYNSNQVNLNEVTSTQGDLLPENLSPYHLKHILEPISSSTARSKFVKYAKSSALLNDWIRREVLLVEKKSAYYIYEQRFKDYLGREKTRTSLLCLLKIEENIHFYKKMTSSKTDEQVRLLESTGTHFEPMMGFYDDAKGLVAQVFNQAHKKKVIWLSDEVEHRIYEIDTPLDTLFEDKEIWIADDYYRYEAALKLRSNLPLRQGEKSTDYIFAALISLQDLSLDLDPSHLPLQKKQMVFDATCLVPKLRSGLLFWSFLEENGF